MNDDADLVEDAAVRMLERLLDGVRSKRLAVVRFAGEDTPEACQLTVGWAMRASVESVDRPPSTVDVTQPRRLRADQTCPDCGMGRLADVVDVLCCPNCSRQYPVD